MNRAHVRYFEHSFALIGVEVTLERQLAHELVDFAGSRLAILAVFCVYL